MHKFRQEGKKAKIHKNRIAVATLVLAVLLLSTSLTTAMAKQQKRFEFHSVVKGSGIIYWGVAALPTVQWGIEEYHVVLDDSKMKLAGASDAQEETASWPAEKMLTLSNIRLEENELTIIWTHGDTRYELHLRLLSTCKTDGMYGWAWWPRQGDGLVYDTLGEVAYLGVNLKYSPDIDMFNPRYATLKFKGTYRVGSGEQKISGKAWIGMSKFYGTGFYGKAMSLYLWIPELRKYATIGWRSEELETTGWEQVPPARVIRIYMKEEN